MIFTITIMKMTEDNKDTKRQRTWGYAETFKKAQEWVMANAGDMFEDGYYQHAVIEKFAPSPLAHAEQENWYFATYEKDSERNLTGPVVSFTPKPESLKNVCSFAMG